MSKASERKIAIIGTGFSGLCLGIHLKKIGIASFVLYEKADAIGGTWRDNTYPGSECDVPSALYSFSFERNPGWKRKWSYQPVILEYMEHCAKKYDLYRNIRFNQEVSDARFDEDSGQWTVETTDGSSEQFDILVAGTGQLSIPSTPAFEGADSYKGAQFHSARWDHSIDLTGKRVNVVGNAASALQFIPQIAKIAAQVNVFQRTPNWVLPKKGREYWEIEKAIGTIFPPVTKLYRLWIWLRGEGLFYPLMKQQDTRVREKSEEASIEYMEERIHDADLRRKLIPDYPMGAKRVLLSDDYYDALDRDNVEVITDSIHHLEEKGVATEDGTLYEADVVVYATGFESTTFLTPMRVQGRDGQVLNDIWQENGAEAYLGITHTGFPNFFMMYGPNTNLGHNSILIMIEAQTRYILSALDALSANGANWLDVKADVQEKYNAWIRERMNEKIWSTVPESWYQVNGKVTNNWVGRTPEYVKRTKTMNPDDYEFA